MKNKPEEPPRIAVKFANMVFVLGILFCVLTAVYASYRIFNPIYDYSLGNKGIEKFYIISMLSGGVFATLFGLGLKRLSNNLKVNLSVLFFTIGIAVYGFETYLELSKPPKREIIAKQMGVPYDTRTKMEVLDDLRDSGVEAYPNVFPFLFVGPSTQPFLRDSDGLAFSSRNRFLSKSERQDASSVYQSLQEVSAWPVYPLTQRIKIYINERITRNNGSVYYVDICCAETLKELDVIDKETVIVVAARFGEVDIWDNIIIKP